MDRVWFNFTIENYSVSKYLYNQSQLDPDQKVGEKLKRLKIDFSFLNDTKIQFSVPKSSKFLPKTFNFVIILSKFDFALGFVKVQSNHETVGEKLID